VRSGVIRIGTSGWEYPHWKRVFYPPRLQRAQWFAFYARLFDTVEINNSFYRLPSEETFAKWRDRAPDGFTYAVKMSRYATHFKRLLDPEEPMKRFIVRVRSLAPRLGPILIHLPPRWRSNPKRLADFLSTAPRDLRWAVEVRDPSWLEAPVYAVLRRHHAALCIHDLIPDHPRVITAPFVYLRFHGVVQGGSYSARRLDREARRVEHYRDLGLDVFAYFNNDAGGRAVKNALALKALLGQVGGSREEVALL
jgi:uncharacterized protein YecE (DUF72 family)